MERMCFIFWSETGGGSESEPEQRSEKPSDARIRNLGRRSIVGGSDERNGQKRCLAKPVTDLLFEVPVFCCEGVDGGDSSSRR